MHACMQGIRMQSAWMGGVLRAGGLRLAWWWQRRNSRLLPCAEEGGETVQRVLCVGGG